MILSGSTASRRARRCSEHGLDEQDRSRREDRPGGRDRTTHLAYKPEHAVDLDSGVVVAAPIHPADDGEHDDVAGHAGGGGAQPRRGRFLRRRRDRALRSRRRREGYRSREGLKKTSTAASGKPGSRNPNPLSGLLRWHGEEAARDTNLRQPRAIEIWRRTRRPAPTRQNLVRTQLRSCPRSRRDAPRLAAPARRTSTNAT